MELSWREKARYYSYLVARPPSIPTRHIKEEQDAQKPLDRDDIDFSTHVSLGLFRIVSVLQFVYVKIML